MTRPSDFPAYGSGGAKPYIDELVRLLSPDLFRTLYADGRSSARLLTTALDTYGAAKNNPRWATSPVLQRVQAEVGGQSRKFNIVCAALFDLLCNAEYIRGRLVNRSWIYCNRERQQEGGPCHAYYSFLKQCPCCCQDRGLESRLEGAQHKPSSHHIGEITTTAIALFLTLLGHAGPRPVKVGVISKQSHDVDAIAWRDDLLILFEIKASPLVTFPLRTRLARPYTEAGENGPVEIAQHKLIDVDYASHELCLFLANTGVDLPLGTPSGGTWPYPQITEHMQDQERLLDYIEAWAEIFHAYPALHSSRPDIAAHCLVDGFTYVPDLRRILFTKTGPLGVTKPRLAYIQL